MRPLADLLPELPTTATTPAVVELVARRKAITAELDDVTRRLVAADTRSDADATAELAARRRELTAELENTTRRLEMAKATAAASLSDVAREKLAPLERATAIAVLGAYAAATVLIGVQKALRRDGFSAMGGPLACVPFVSSGPACEGTAKRLIAKLTAAGVLDAAEAAEWSARFPAV